MAYLVNPNLAYVLIIVGITLFFLVQLNPKSKNLKIGMAVFLAAAVLELLFIRVNPWAFLGVALSPFIFMYAVRQGHPHNPLFLLSIGLLVLGSFFLFMDQENQPLVSLRLAWVSVLSAAITWISTERLRNVQGGRVSNSADSVVGLIGKTMTDIEPYSAGSVLVDREVWQARSEKPIPAGSTVRVLRQDGFWLTVKQVESMTQK